MDIQAFQLIIMINKNPNNHNHNHIDDQRGWPVWLPRLVSVLRHQACNRRLQQGTFIHKDDKSITVTTTKTTYQVLRLELEKFGVDVVTIQPGDFSKATHLLDRWENQNNNKTTK